jgi:hypothetical protein
VQPDILEKHAGQFDVDLPDRVAGSDEELAASTYILGTLQRAGYTVRLDPVPVGNLVNSSNVIALPPSGDDPAYMVVVPYDVNPTKSAREPFGRALGLFLELARALRAVDPDHYVAFGALGAEFSERNGGALGSRRLARYLLDEDQDPVIVRLLNDIDLDPEGQAYGPGSEPLDEIFAEQCRARTEGECSSAGPLRTIEPDPLKEAGFRQILVTGGVEDVGAALLEYLQQ